MDETEKSILNIQRVVSIDVFRGLTIALMIFVNTVAGVKNIPLWLKHAPADVDGMTLPDIVFPAFLFIVGMAIPFALRTRERKGQKKFEIWGHIFIRTIGLLALGFFMVNSYGGYDENAMSIPISLWALNFYVCAILIWNKYSFSKPYGKVLFTGLRILGVVGLASLFWLYHSKEGRWMQPRWWGILGLIGWAYLIGCTIYVGLSRNITSLVSAMALLVFINLGIHSNKLTLPSFLGFIHGQAGNAAHSILVVAGIILSQFLIETDKDSTLKTRIKWMLCFAGILFISAFFLRPVLGISKIRGTATWALYCTCINVVVFTFLYWLIDIKKVQKWSGFLMPAARNPLLTYILPSIILSLNGWLNLINLPGCFYDGIFGIIYSIFFVCLILLATYLLTKLHIRLHL
jgi:predicted acyltransferase